MRDHFLLFSPPSIGQEEIDEVVDTLKSQWITTGPKTQRFAKEFMEFVHAPAALPLNSCTGALHLALAATGIGSGDEVITTPMTFAASINVIEHVGAKPVLVDVEPDTLNIDPDQIRRAVTSRTKAILIVHYAGHPVELNRVMAVANEYQLTVIEDAAHALPARYHGQFVGSSGNPTAFSFYATKNLTTAEGGMLTGTPEFVEKARVLSLHGMSRDAWQRYGKGGSWYYEITMPGFKYNMTDIQAAMGLVQLGKLRDFQARRCQIVKLYNEAFSDIPALQVPTERNYVEHAWHLYVLRLNQESLTIGRDQFIEELRQRNIGSSVHFIPLHLHPYYRDKYGYQPEDFPVAYSNYQRLLSLPLHPKLTDDDVADVIEAVCDVVRSHRR
ncbi:MAG TPA: DegT/DnrJ/EryC1/StrS aminotransferase family protein [Gammaproteobacteria bacterium]|nr:DegT/DnrJ/EryC1/StrS aminotransferase family protein [Gammaproteobacteria bacterium]